MWIHSLRCNLQKVQARRSELLISTSRNGTSHPHEAQADVGVPELLRER
jgi:hypothetical protein